MGLLTALTVVYLALRPPEPRPLLTPDDEARMRALLDGPHGGRDSLGYFALRRDKSVVWSPSGQVGDRLPGGVRRACSPAATRWAIRRRGPARSRSSCAEADEHAWTPAVIGCSEAGRHGLRSGGRLVRARVR